MKKILLVNTVLIASLTPVISMVSCNKNKEPSYEEQYLTFEALEDGDLSCDIDNTGAHGRTININLHYSLNGGTWTKLETNVGGATKQREHFLPYKKGDKVRLKNDSEYWSFFVFTSKSDYDYWYTKLHFTGLVNVFGNVMSLLYGDDFVGKKSFKHAAAFSELFVSIDSFDGEMCEFDQVKDAKNLILPATKLEDSCYFAMFDSCHNLQIAPSNLPALNSAIYCYDCMFESCSCLQIPPNISIQTSTVTCCWSMFRNCQSLSIATEPSISNHKFFTCPNDSSSSEACSEMFDGTIGGIVTPTPGQDYYWVEAK